MRIGMDIDGVLIDAEQYAIYYISKYCAENNIAYEIKDSNYNFYKTFNITEQEEDDF